MRPFSLLVKPASADCNLACDYCFYREKSGIYPESSVHRMSDEVLRRLVSAYLETPQPAYSFGWQGGEPTLMGEGFFKRVTELQEHYGRRGTTVSNGLQTNGTLITDGLARHLAQYKFLVGLSIDGPADLHDGYRQRVGGGGSHAAVIRGIETLRRHGVEFNVLVLVSAANVGQGKRVYRYLRDELGVLYHQYIPCVELDDGGRPLPFSITGAQWGAFLNQVFDEWLGQDTQRVSVRNFDMVMAHLLGDPPAACTMAGDCRQYFVIEHNGDVYPCDFFVSPETRLGNILDQGLAELWHSPAYRNFGLARRKTAEVCAACRFQDLCRGDCQKHRLEAPAPHPSHLCEGWQAFYSHSLELFKDPVEEARRQRTRAMLHGERPFNS